MGALVSNCSKWIILEPLVYFFTAARFLYIPIIEQYYYHYYGEAILKNTTFEFPAGAYCINSSMIDEYTENNNSYKQDESSSNDLVVYNHLSGRIPAIFVAIAMGSLTDKYGRKLGIFIPTCGYLIQGVASILIIYYQLNPYYFIAVSAVCGLTGEHTTVIASCFAYTADSSSIKWRSFRIAVLEAMLDFGKLSGQLAGGFWLSKIHCNFLPLMITYTVIWPGIALYLFILPESLAKEEDQVSKRKITLAKLGEAARIYCSKCSYKTWALYVATIALGMAVFNMSGSFLLSVYFLKAIPFEFSPLQISYYQALRSAMEGICNTLFFFFAVFKVRDSLIMLFAFIVNGSCNLLLGFATKSWEVYAISGFQGIEGAVFASGRGLASKLVNPEQQGALFGIIASAESLASLAGSTVWSYVFPITLKHNMRVGMVFILISAFGFVMVPLMLSVLCIHRNKLQESQGTIQNSGLAKTAILDTSKTTSVYISENEGDPILSAKSAYGTINS